MIELHTFNTPNGRKVSICLEEMGLAYRAHRVDITQDDQFKPDFLAISPNNKIPAIVDPDGPSGAPHSVFETGAILIYLAEKTGRFLPKDPVGRAVTLQWLMWQMGGAGPMFGQCGHFVKFAPEDVHYAKKRYTEESKRLLGVLDRRLATASHVAGAEYTIADMATLPWVAVFEFYGIPEILDPFENVKAWMARLRARPAVEKGWAVEYVDG